MATFWEIAHLAAPSVNHMFSLHLSLFVVLVVLVISPILVPRTVF